MVKYGIVLAAVIILSAVLHWTNLSPYYIYPDSYQNILTAHHIQNFHSVVGTLGPDGQIWPDYFGWTRPGYALLMYGVSRVTGNYFTAAQAVTFTATILSTIIAYFFLKILSGSRITGLCAALLVGISANYIIWGGLILTEGLGILALLLVLWSFFIILKRESQLAEVRDLVCGVTIAFAILVRYEYALLLIPIISAIIIRSPSPGKKLLNLLSAMVFILSLVGAQLFPLRESLSRINSQNYVLQVIGIGLLIIFIVGAAVFRYRQNNSGIYKWSSAVSLAAAGTIAVILLVQILFTGFSFLTYQLGAPRNFFTLDFLLGITVVIGFYQLHQGKKYTLVTWAAVNIAMFALFYYLVNPLMQRYWTHLIPFLLIPAAYGLQALYPESVFSLFHCSSSPMQPPKGKKDPQNLRV